MANIRGKDIEHLILYDGLCAVCNHFVQFVLKYDTKQRFYFAALQSDIAKEFMTEELESIDSVVYIHNKQTYIYSSAALRVIAGLGGLWRAASVLLLVPRFIRNGVYKFIAKYRYRWFGKHDACILPKKEWQARFL